MSEVIKMHEQNQASQSYKTLFPGSTHPASSSMNSSPPQDPCSHVHTHSCQPSTQPQYCYLQTHLSCHCTSHPIPRYCHCTIVGPENNDIDNVKADLQELKTTFGKLQDEMVDVVDKIDSLNNKVEASESRNPTPSAIPLFRNPDEIPELHRMETVTDDEVPSGNISVNESVVSMEESVPDITNISQTMTVPTIQPHLN